MSLKAIAKETPGFGAYIDELHKNPNIEIEFVEAVGVNVKYHDEFEN